MRLGRGSSVVEHSPCKRECAGSSPAPGSADSLSVRATLYAQVSGTSEGHRRPNDTRRDARSSRAGIRHLSAIWREHAIRPRHRRRRTAATRSVQDGASYEGVRRVPNVEFVRSSPEPEGHATALQRPGRLLRGVLPTDGRDLLDSDRWPARRPGASSSHRAIEPPAKADSARERLPDRVNRAADADSQASTSRVFWCARIFRLTRWSALSIVFVSQPRSSAISS
jgi:hypothetical protein